jgi:phage/plasmid-like protein (TIGR03299 family)
MFHLISQPVVNTVTVTEAALSGTPAWHNLGTVFAPGSGAAMNSTEAAKASNLANWEPVTGSICRPPVLSSERAAEIQQRIELAKNGDISPLLEWAQSYTNGGFSDHTVIPGFQEVYRSDNLDNLGVVGEKYVPFKNLEAFAFLDSLTADGVMQYETAFALRGGKQIALLCRLPTVDMIGENGDVQKRYICLTNSHDGTGAIKVLPTSIRVVCQNTLALALKKGKEQTMRCSHNASAVSRGDRLQEMRLYLSQFDTQFAEYRADALTLLGKHITDADWTAYVRALWPLSEIDGARAQTNATNRERILSRLFREDATNNMPGMRGTWWAAFNAVTQYLDHYSNYRGENAPSNRFLSITTGPAAALKAKAFSLALSAV